MKITKVLALFAALAFAASAHAAETVKLTNVHLCCNSCVKGADAAVKKVDGATAEIDKDAGTVTISAGDKATAQKAVNSLLAAGYFAKSDSSDVKLVANTASDAKVSSLKVSGVHLCCKKCVTAVNKAVGSVDGVKGTDAEPKGESFTVSGNFSPKAVLKALNDAGLDGKAQ